MADIIGGVKITGFISPTDTLDEYPVIEPLYGVDGVRTVTGTTERNNIPNARRRQGMIVGVHTGDTVQYYTLLKNSGWAGDDTDWLALDVTGSTSPITLELTNSLFATKIQAGQGATVSNYSNFIGFQAGISTSEASGSTLMGSGAGAYTNKISNSNFFGLNTGQFVISGSNSNFFGQGIGNSATNVTDSNFFGQNVAIGVSNVTNSNFFGDSAGQNASNTNDSNFFGFYAGLGATNSSGSTFFGELAGYVTANANDSIFLGSEAGQQATNSSGSTFLGRASGYQAGNANNSNFLGRFAGQEAFNAANSNFLGTNVGFAAINANNSNFIGNNAGVGATGANNSNFIGYFAGSGATNASYSTFLGFRTGQSLTGSNNIIIGTHLTLNNNDQNALNIGGVLFGTGLYSATTSNPSTNPADGKIGINVVPTAITNALHVSASTDPVRFQNLSASTSNNFYLVGDSNGQISNLGGNVATRISFFNSSSAITTNSLFTFSNGNLVLPNAPNYSRISFNDGVVQMYTSGTGGAPFFIYVGNGLTSYDTTKTINFVNNGNVILQCLSLGTLVSTAHTLTNIFGGVTILTRYTNQGASGRVTSYWGVNSRVFNVTGKRFTDFSTTANTQEDISFNSFGKSTLSGITTGTTYSGISTVFIANAPSRLGNVSGNTYALKVNAGATTLGGKTILSDEVEVLSGSNKAVNVVKLISGFFVVANSLIKTNSTILLTKQSNTSTGKVAISAKSTGFMTITSTSGTDTDDVAYMIINTIE